MQPINPYSVRPEANPSNRFASMQVEFEDGVELPQEIRIHKEVAKTIVSENTSPDIPFRFSVNPYRGCAHACAYCYARPTHEYLGLGAGTDFDTQIYAKTNAAELLRRKLASRNWDRQPITFSGVTDCYQPAEAKLRLTRSCLEVCVEFAQPVSIITKSTLIIRDLDVLTALNGRAETSAVLSIPFADEATARLIEPFAAPPSLRFKALEKLSAAGLRAGISLGPIIPGLNDSDIPTLLARAKDAGATFAFYVMLRLPGAVRDVFLDRIRERLPDRAGKIEHHVREVLDGQLYQTDFGDRMSGTGTMADMVDKLFRIHARKLGLETGERAEGIGPSSVHAIGEIPAGVVVREIPVATSGPGNQARHRIEYGSGRDMRKDPHPATLPPADSGRSGRPPKIDTGQLDLFAT